MGNSSPDTYLSQPASEEQLEFLKECGFYDPESASVIDENKDESASVIDENKDDMFVTDEGLLQGSTFRGSESASIIDESVTLQNVVGEKRSRWAGLTDKQKSAAVTARKRLRQLDAARRKIGDLQKDLQEFSDKLKEQLHSSIIFPDKQKQIDFLSEWLAVDYTHLTDLELKIKYASVFLVKKEYPKLKQKKFMKKYADSYFEYDFTIDN